MVLADREAGADQALGPLQARVVHVRVEGLGERRRANWFGERFLNGGRYTEDDFEPYGRHKAKISLDVLKRHASGPDGHLVLVTGITPTPAGEGKSTTTVGVSDALRKLGKRSVVALREPSLGPCFGVKGGAAGHDGSGSHSRGGDHPCGTGQLGGGLKLTMTGVPHGQPGGR